MIQKPGDQRLLKRVKNAELERLDMMEDNLVSFDFYEREHND